MNAPVAEFYPAVSSRPVAAEWIVLPESTPTPCACALGGGEKDESLIYLPLERQPSVQLFPWPSVAQARNHSASQLLMDALQLKLRSGRVPSAALATSRWSRAPTSSFPC